MWQRGLGTQAWRLPGTTIPPQCCVFKCRRQVESEGRLSAWFSKVWLQICRIKLVFKPISLISITPGQQEEASFYVPAAWLAQAVSVAHGSSGSVPGELTGVEGVGGRGGGKGSKVLLIKMEDAYKKNWYLIHPCILLFMYLFTHFPNQHSTSWVFTVLGAWDTSRIKQWSSPAWSSHLTMFSGSGLADRPHAGPTGKKWTGEMFMEREGRGGTSQIWCTVVCQRCRCCQVSRVLLRGRVLLPCHCSCRRLLLPGRGCQVPLRETEFTWLSSPKECRCPT